MSTLHFSLLRALRRCCSPFFSQSVYNLPCQVINDINIWTILPWWYPGWLFWPYLSQWKPLSCGFAVDMPGHLDQHWLKQIVLWKQQGEDIRERIYPPLVHTHTWPRVHTSKDVAVLCTKPDTQLSGCVRDSDKVQQQTVKHRRVTRGRGAVISQIKPLGEILF